MNIEFSQHDFLLVFHCFPLVNLKDLPKCHKVPKGVSMNIIEHLCHHISSRKHVRCQNGSSVGGLTKNQGHLLEQPRRAGALPGSQGESGQVKGGYGSRKGVDQRVANSINWPWRTRFFFGSSSFGEPFWYLWYPLVHQEMPSGMPSTALLRFCLARSRSFIDNQWSVRWSLGMGTG